MKYAVDKIIDDIVLLENIETGQKEELSIMLLPSSIKEGSIIVYKEGTYYLDNKEEDRRRKEILERFMRLRDNS